jgi:fatty acid CoA ligase FadD22
MSNNLAEYLAALARENGWNPRPAYHIDDETFTFGDVHSGTGRFAAALAALGVHRGDRVLLALPDGIDLVRAFLAVLRLGAVAVPVNTEMHPGEIARAAKIADPHVIVAEAGLADVFDQPVIDPAEVELPPAPAPYAEVTEDTPAFAVFTSGTTGDPKLCFHNHGDPAVFERAIGNVVALTPADVTLSMSRMYFAYGLGNSLFFPLHRGGATVLCRRRPDAGQALALLVKHGVTVLYGQPSFFARLLQHPGHGALGDLRLALVAGEVLPDTLEAEVREVLGERLLNIFGTTEIGHALISNALGASRDGTIGRVLAPYRMRIVDESGAELPADVEGSLEVCGPTIAPGVNRGSDPPLRAGEDWYATGDAATVDGDGYVRLHGRLDDIEIVGGQNVHPAEIEDLLMAHPEVQEAGVCAIRRAAGVTTLRAFLALRTEASQPDTVRAEVLTSAKERLTWYKIPEDVVFVTALPRTPVGKLNRRALREMATAR